MAYGRKKTVCIFSYKAYNMDVVYVLGTGSLWKNNEMRYSLRSIEKYLKGYDNVFIVGECPDWTTNVIHLPCPDVRKRKELSIMRKIMTACTHQYVSDDFVFFNDDHFVLRPIDTKDIKYWYNSTLDERSMYAEGPNMRKIENTIEIMPDESNFFDIHVPMIYNKEEFRRVMEDPDIKWEEKDYLVKTLYSNMSILPAVTHNTEFMSDCKISTILGYDVLKERIKERYFFSIGPKGVRADLKRLMNELYPDKSKYER